MSQRIRRLSLLLLAGLTLAGAGCLAVAAGAAGAGAATYVYFKGKVCQDYHAGFADAWKAVADALKEQGLPLLRQENDGSSGTITSRTAAPDESTISIRLSTEGEAGLVRVCVRIGTLGDQAVSERILAQIGSHLTPTGVPPPPGAPPKLGPIQQTGWNKPSETAPPPELPAEPMPVRKP